MRPAKWGPVEAAPPSPATSCREEEPVPLIGISEDRLEKSACITDSGTFDRASHLLPPMGITRAN